MGLEGPGTIGRLEVEVKERNCRRGKGIDEEKGEGRREVMKLGF
jgi:hypothetical protein